MLHKILYYKMLVSNYSSLGNKIISVLDQYNKEELKLEIPKSKIEKAISLLKKSTAIIRKNKYTKMIKQADWERDNAWLCFFHAILSASYSPDNKRKKAAKLIVPLVKNKNMILSRMGYQKKTAKLLQLFKSIDELNRYRDAIDIMNIQNEYQNLKTKQRAFELIEIKKIEDKSLQPKSDRELACKNLQSAIDDLSQFLKVSNLLEPNDKYVTITSEINQVIAENNTLVSARYTRLKNARKEHKTSDDLVAELE